MAARDIYTEVGEHVRARRRHLGLTLEDLEGICGLSASYIGQIERDVKKASLKTLGTLATAMGVQVSSLFDPAGPLKRLPLEKSLDAIIATHPPKERSLLIATLRQLAGALKNLR